MDFLAQLTQKTLILVAHPDDESIGCGGLVQRMREAAIFLCTDGAPHIPAVWIGKGFRTREAYAEARYKEIQDVIKLGKVKHREFMTGVADQQLHEKLPIVLKYLSAHIDSEKPNAILTHAYEGGHPDHDCCSFLASIVSKRFSVPAYEMPFYWKSPAGPLVFQKFMNPSPNDFSLDLSETEIIVKKKMFQAHRTQSAVLADFDLSREFFRLQPEYDYSVAANPAFNTFAVCAVSVESVLSRFRSLER